MSLSPEFLLIASLIILGFALVLWFINRKLSTRPDDSSQAAVLEWLKSTQADIKSLQQNLTHTLQRSDKNVTDTLQKSYGELNTRLDTAARVIGQLKEETGKFSEIGRSMKQLQDFLSSPKLRGNIGEAVLSDLLAQTLPKQTYTLQYRFPSGDIVDVVVKTQAGLIPIDSKFPMENFTSMTTSESAKEKGSYKKLFIRDVKKHVKDISQKYIQVGDGTVDFAVMYIPSESLYYEIMANTPEVYDYAQAQRVLPVSPATFYAFLRTILLSFEGQRITQEAQAILKNLKDIHKAATDFSGKLDTLSRHLTNAYNNMNTVSADFTRLQGKIDDTQSLGSGLNDMNPPQISSD